MSILVSGAAELHNYHMITTSDAFAVRGEDIDRIDSGCTVTLPLTDAGSVTFEWGRRDAFGTPAFWAAEAATPRVAQPWRDHQPGDLECLIRDVAYCLLGGYRVRADVNKAALRAVEEAGLLKDDDDEGTRAERLEAVLSARLPGRRGGQRYPFPRQRAERLASALQALREIGDSLVATPSARSRDALLGLVGVGPKTASWIVRNHFGAEDVAIIDVHIERAGRAAGIFLSHWRLPRDYHLFETAFIGFARVAGVSAATLDLVMWTQMRSSPRAVALLPHV